VLDELNELEKKNNLKDIRTKIIFTQMLVILMMFWIYQNQIQLQESPKDVRRLKKLLIYLPAT